jgi:uncharacterized protein YgfB (UPF0149 family)
MHAWFGFKWCLNLFSNFDHAQAWFGWVRGVIKMMGLAMPSLENFGELERIISCIA